ncbi:MAG: FAD-dependent oxidoreductase [Lachnospiraceae bacterium]|nr:FAD-dependent oxidoreductase [Lachnospiraceae bacterium]
MLRINQLKLPVGHSREELAERVKKLLRCKETPRITIVRRSIDARKKPRLYFNYILNVQVADQQEVYRRCDKSQVLLWEEKTYQFPAADYKGKKRPVIIGTGPAGLFCGYMLAEAGFCPILLERGKPVEERTGDVERFWETGKLNPESNVQFGEGGAGTFSDGKLNTLVKDKYGRNREVLSLFVKAGAPEEILYDHKPHIGTDVLCRVVSNLRKAILDKGGEVRFGAKVTDFEIEKGQISGVVINGKERLGAEYVILAPGHSARDTFSVLYEKGVAMEPKAFAVGLRVEHPQKMINFSQYGKTATAAEEEILGSAAYKVTAKAADGRGVYSFCMCPGGYVVNASSEPGRLAVNGMSFSKRDGENANSAVIVSVTPKDYGGSHPLAGVEFQRRLEEKAFEIGKGSIPVERYGSFRAGVTGNRDCKSFGDGFKLPDDFAPCIKGKWSYQPVHQILPQPLNVAFVEGMEQFGKIIKGFNDENVLIEGVESRTSSPVRILRDERMQASVKGLYPCGEGAGYAGGITSAAMDGIRVAEEVAGHIMESEN